MADILDANGDPIGSYRVNQDPTEPTRLHPVPRTNSDGETIIDDHTGEPDVVLLPLDDPRVVTQLETEGLAVDGTVIVEAGEPGPGEPPRPGKPPKPGKP
jgi:hypothetical protein